MKGWLGMGHIIKGFLITVVGIGVCGLALYLGIHVLGLKWWNIPLYVIFDYRFSVGWMTWLSYGNELISLVGVIVLIYGLYTLFSGK